MSKDTIHKMVPKASMIKSHHNPKEVLGMMIPSHHWYPLLSAIVAWGLLNYVWVSYVLNTPGALRVYNVPQFVSAIAPLTGVVWVASVVGWPEASQKHLMIGAIVLIAVASGEALQASLLVSFLTPLWTPPIPVDYFLLFQLPTVVYYVGLSVALLYLAISVLRQKTLPGKPLYLTVLIMGVAGVCQTALAIPSYRELLTIGHSLSEILRQALLPTVSHILAAYVAASLYRGEEWQSKRNILGLPVAIPRLAGAAIVTYAVDKWIQFQTTNLLIYSLFAAYVISILLLGLGLLLKPSSAAAHDQPSLPLQ